MEDNSCGIKLKSIVGSLLVLVILFIVIPNFMDGSFGNKSIEAAEKHVNQQVYVTLGITCEKYDSNVIYKSKDIQLISVKFYTKGSPNAAGSYCVYCVNGYVINSTNMMGAEYSYKEHIDELKALFGI